MNCFSGSYKLQTDARMFAVGFSMSICNVVQTVIFVKFVFPVCSKFVCLNNLKAKRIFVNILNRLMSEIKNMHVFLYKLFYNYCKNRFKIRFLTNDYRV